MRKKGVMGSIISIFTALALFGIFLAVLNQFDGSLSEMLKWILNACWSVVVSVRDTVASWDVFRGLF